MKDYTPILRQADIFYLFTSTQLDLINQICEEKTFQADEIIFEEISDSDELYIIAEGEIDILIDPSLVSDSPELKREPTAIATLRRGQSFGEIALVDQGLRSATAQVVQEQARLLRIPRDQLIALCDAHPELGYRLMRNLAADLALKIRSADLHLREQLLYTKAG